MSAEALARLKIQEIALRAKRKQSEKTVVECREKLRVLKISILKLKKEKKEPSSYDTQKKENIKLRQLVAVAFKSDGVTYKEVGKMLGLSGSRAKQIIQGGLKDLINENNL